MAEQRKTGARQNDGRQGGLRQKITGGQFRTEMRQARAGAFLFFGDENFLKRRELESLRDKICADENAAAFNHFIKIILHKVQAILIEFPSLTTVYKIIRKSTKYLCF